MNVSSKCCKIHIIFRDQWPKPILILVNQSRQWSFVTKTSRRNGRLHSCVHSHARTVTRLYVNILFTSMLHMRIMPEWWGTWCSSARKRRIVLLRADRNPERQEPRKIFLHSSSCAPQWNARDFYIKLVWSFVTIAREQVSVTISRSIFKMCFL